MFDIGETVFYVSSIKPFAAACWASLGEKSDKPVKPEELHYWIDEVDVVSCGKQVAFIKYNGPYDHKTCVAKVDLCKLYRTKAEALKTIPANCYAFADNTSTALNPVLKTGMNTAQILLETTRQCDVKVISIDSLYEDKK